MNVALFAKEVSKYTPPVCTYKPGQFHACQYLHARVETIHRYGREQHIILYECFKDEIPNEEL
jgi:hypothetical protein